MICTNLEEKNNPDFIINDNIIMGKKRKEETRSVPKILLDSMTEASDRIGLINADTDEKVTYAQMKDRSVRCAVWLKKQGIMKNDIISISSPSQMHDYVPYFATYYVNAISSPWHFKFTKASAEYYFNLMEPKIVFACEQSIDALAQVAEELNSDCKFVVFGKHPKFKSLEDILSEQTQEEVDGFTHIEPEDPKNQVAVMLSTSGTTGNPKAIMLSYQSLAWIDILTKNSVPFWYAPLLWNTGALFTLNCAYLQGMRIVHGDFNPQKTARVMQKYRVNWMFCAPRALISMCKEGIFKSFDFPSLEVMTTGGAFVSETVLKEIQDALHHALVRNALGQTEAGGLVCGVTRNCKKIASVGHVGSGMNLKVIDLQTGKALGANERGEICLKSDRMLLGYYKNPEATKKTIDEEGWLHTGDLGYYDENGEVTLMSRIKDVIITEHFQIFLSEIEAILLQHPDVKEAAVTSVPHEVDGQRPIAFVVKSPDAKVTAEELQEISGKYNKFYRVTGGVIFVDRLPYTASDKVKISELKEWAKAYSIPAKEIV